MSAIRACDVYRATKDIPGGSLKVINKNKLKDDLKTLRLTKCRILAATCGRVTKVLESEESHLKSSEIEAIVCDSSYLDPKKRHLWDSADVIPLIKKIVDENDKARVYLY
ncbi:unnamed protein product [Ambrosiozyma monospora]|uniref:Unnamed protein product n=1 Tax=Ambrosiozyma monospora TaxID=43982 RepID=A0ACB5T8G6_AMBMO|nr:unnamed protein product [Ambrosiozyma monospora]